jgi:YidC/Oxa1 family membrane protein insertase
MPILFGLYQALYILANRPEFANAEFFWIPNLAIPSQTPVTYSGVNFQGTNWISGTISTQQWGLLIAYFSLPIVMLVSQILMQKMSQPVKSATAGKSQAESQTQMMNSMMMFMPLMFGYITLGLPAGLTLYWTTSNLLSMIQQYFVTGWGGLADWFPMLKPKPAVSAAAPAASAALEAPVATSSAITTTGGTPETAPKPEKRRRRRK